MNRTVLALVSATLALGCASETTIRTMPPGAKVTVNNRLVGITPVMYSVRKYDWPRDNTFRYRIEREGCVPKEGEFLGHVSAGTIVRSILLSAGLSLAWNNIMAFPDEIDVELEPIGFSAASSSARPIAERLHRVDDLYEQGLISDQEHRRLRSEILETP